MGHRVIRGVSCAGARGKDHAPHFGFFWIILCKGIRSSLAPLFMAVLLTLLSLSGGLVAQAGINELPRYAGYLKPTGDVADTHGKYR